MITRYFKCCFLTAIVWGMGSIAVAQPAATGPFEIYFIDVAGGAATLLVTPERESVLIDSGWPGLNDRDPKRIVHVLRDLAGCDQLDHLVTTHWHSDHFGGVAGLARLVKIGRFWDRGLPEDGDSRLDFPDGPKPDDPLGIAYRSASAGKRKARAQQRAERIQSAQIQAECTHVISLSRITWMARAHARQSLPR